MIQSILEWQEIPENMERVKQRIEKRRIARENYDGKYWDQSKEMLTATPFPDNQISEQILDKNTDFIKDEYHMEGQERHALNSYTIKSKLGYFPLFWRYSYCPLCDRVVTKKGVLLNKYENLAFIRYFVRKGEVIAFGSEKHTETKPIEKAKERPLDFHKVADLMAEPIDSHLKGGDNK